MEFERGVQKRQRFEAGDLPDEEKERLCTELLETLGAQVVRVSPDGEMQHSCVFPDHNDSSPSASLNYRKLVYACLGCGRSGGLLWLIGLAKGTTATEARSWLKKQTGEEVQDLAVLLELFDRIYAPSKRDEPPMPKLHSKILEPWLYIHPYMIEVRGCREDVLKRFRVGWDPKANRIVVPHFWQGELVGWQTRRLVQDRTPKWKSSVDFPKRYTAFSYDPRRREAVVVESPMSVLRHAHHLPLEATFGASVTDRQKRLFAAHARVVLFFDNDRAGWAATRDVGEALSPYSKVFVADNPYKADPADLSDEVVEQVVANAVPFSIWEQPSKLEPLQDQAS